MKNGRSQSVILLLVILNFSCVDTTEKLKEQYSLNGMWAIQGMLYGEDQLREWFYVNAIVFYDENDSLGLTSNPTTSLNNHGNYKLYHEGNKLDSIKIFSDDTTFVGTFKFVEMTYSNFKVIPDSVLMECVLEDDKRLIYIARMNGW